MTEERRPQARLMIAGVHSGVGKSSITLALVAALKKHGLKVQTFKVGPDYLDPGHLSHVSGRPCYNLDGWMCDRAYVERLFHEGSEGADISLIEGVMGLFDGSSVESLSGSSAEIAAWLQCPVALVVNVHGMARSLAALIKGYNEFDADVRLAGVIANRCGSDSHADLLSKALAAAGQPPLLGAVRRDSLPALPSRHLGLVSAAEERLEAGTIDQLARTAKEQINLDLLLKQAQETVPIPSADDDKQEFGLREPQKVRLAVARDEAFQFYYPDFFNALEERGCRPVFFSPLRDAALPDHISGLYLGGGYPEIHAQALSNNSAMLDAVRSFCASGRPVYAECGGLIYLTRGVEMKGEYFSFVGELPVWARMLDKRKALGYVEACLQQDSLWGRAGSICRGHEFHYSELVDDPAGLEDWRAVYRLTQKRSGKERCEGYQRGNVLASYAHLHLASRPKALDNFVQKLREQQP